MKFFHFSLSVVLIATAGIPLVALDASARPCGNDIFSRVGCAMDPTNPPRNGGGGMTALNMAAIIGTFRASGQVTSRGHCRGIVYDAYRKAWDLYSGMGDRVQSYMNDQLEAGYFACDREYPSGGVPPSIATSSLTKKSLVITPSNGIAKCLDAAAETILNERGTLQLYRCNGSGNQLWAISNGRVMMTTPNGVTKCLDAAAETILNERGTLQLYRCNGSGNQMWSFR